MAKAVIKGIIWDLGNVLVGFDHLRAGRKLAQYSPTAPSDIVKKLFTGEHAPETLHESGQVSSQEFFREAQQIVPLSADLSFREFAEIWKDILIENKGVASIVGKVRPEVGRCLLSITDPLHWQAAENLQVLREYFSDPARLIRSYTSGTRKPDPKLYREALACLSIEENDIGSVLYIEDIAKYREAFEDLGGQTLAYDCSKDPLTTLESGLERFGVLQR